jgi:hypothetical protein
MNRLFRWLVGRKIRPADEKDAEPWTVDWHHSAYNDFLNNNDFKSFATKTSDPYHHMIDPIELKARWEAWK